MASSIALCVILNIRYNFHADKVKAVINILEITYVYDGPC